VIDLYRRGNGVAGFYYAGLGSGTHTISVTVLGVSNPNASGTLVSLDFIEVWDGTALPEGSFEARRGDDERIHLSTGWGNYNDATASDGGYVRGSAATAWFPFTGESVTYQALAYNSGGTARVYLDGRYQTTFDLYNPSTITRTLSFTGLTAGPHVLQVSSYRGYATVDAFATPGSAPFYQPPVRSGIIRYEENDSILRYNGTPYTKTATTWGMSSNPSFGSHATSRSG